MRPFIYTLIGLVGFGNGACAQQVPSSVDAGQLSEQLRMNSQNPNETIEGVHVKRSGTDNLYTIEKTPDSGTITLDQDGHGNEADLQQSGGTDNRIDVQQNGKGNRTVVKSSGSGNSVIIRQSNGE